MHSLRRYKNNYKAEILFIMKLNSIRIIIINSLLMNTS